jgi:hypothetical protein
VKRSSDARRSTLCAPLGFCQLAASPAFPEVTTLKRWLSTWSGIGHIMTGMERQGFVVSLRRLVDDGWTAAFHSHHMLAADGIGTAPTAFEAVQVAAWRALNRSECQRRAVRQTWRLMSSRPPAPTLIQPALAKPFHRDGWVYEEKYDGWRMVAYKDGPDVRLVSRRAVDHTKRFPDLAVAIARLPARTLVLDGEVCAFDEALVSHMHLLTDSLTDAVVTPPTFIAFDCLYSRGRDLRSWPLKDRRKVMEEGDRRLPRAAGAAASG